MRLNALLILIVTLALMGGPATEPAAASPAPQGAGGLVADGGFEGGGLAGWFTCGGARLADRGAGATGAEVRSGRYALRLGGPTDDSCGDTLTPQMQAVYEPIIVPADATGLTLSLWYSHVGTFGVGSAFWDLTASLVTNDGGPQVRLTGYIDAETPGGWNQARLELAPGQVAQARGRQFALELYFQFSVSAGNELAYYIDDVAVLPSVARTPLATALPSALRSDGARPLVGVGGGQILRVNRDAHSPLPIYDGMSGETLSPRWLPGGGRIIVQDTTLQLGPGEAPSLSAPQISVLTMMDPQGGGRREVYRTVGKRLVPGSPPGCRPPRTDCLRYDDPAIDSTIRDYSPGPDGRRVAVNYCASSRYADGFTSDPICYLETVDLATGARRALVTGAVDVDWGSNNRILYRVTPNLAGTPPGIYEIDMAAPSPRGARIFAHTTVSDPLQDAGPVWSPDGRSFATLRFVEGNHYDAQGVSRLNAVLMVFDRRRPSLPRQLALVDFGRTLDSPIWSPDSRYILYNVLIGDNLWEVYWIEVATGKTGSLDAAAIFVDWRRDNLFAQRVYLPSTRR